MSTTKEYLSSLNKLSGPVQYKAQSSEGLYSLIRVKDMDSKVIFKSRNIWDVKKFILNLYNKY